MRLLVFLPAVWLVLTAMLGCEDSAPPTPGSGPSAAAPWTPPITVPKGSGVVRVVVPPSGVLEVSPESVDFGLVGPASTHPTTFVLTNRGSSPITVASVTTSCACTTTGSIDGLTIPPAARSTSTPPSLRRGNQKPKHPRFSFVFKASTNRSS